MNNLQIIWLKLLQWLQQTFQRVPSGHDSQSAHAYYAYLHAQYLAQIPENRTTILWSGPMWIAIYGILLILFFYLYVRFLIHTHRTKGEMYGAVSFAGSILERIGPVSTFTWIVSTIFILWALYYIVVHIFVGQQYWGVLYY